MLWKLLSLESVLSLLEWEGRVGLCLAFLTGNLHVLNVSYGEEKFLALHLYMYMWWWWDNRLGSICEAENIILR